MVDAGEVLAYIALEHPYRAGVVGRESPGQSVEPIYCRMGTPPYPTGIAVVYPGGVEHRVQYSVHAVVQHPI